MACWNGIVIQAMVLKYLKPELFENTYIGTYKSMISIDLAGFFKDF